MDDISSFFPQSINEYKEEWEWNWEPLNNIFEILNDFE